MLNKHLKKAILKLFLVHVFNSGNKSFEKDCDSETDVLAVTIFFTSFTYGSGLVTMQFPII